MDIAAASEVIRSARPHTSGSFLLIGVFGLLAAWHALAVILA